MTREKLAILECLEDKGLEKRLTLKPLEAKVHVIPMNHLRIQVGTSLLRHALGVG